MPTTSDTNGNAPDPRPDGLGERTITQAVYLLQALSFAFGVTAVVGVVLNHLYLARVRGTWLETHFRWQIRTFWLGLFWSLLGLLTYVLVVGWVILLGVYLWTLYRVVKGAINFFAERPMYADSIN